MFNDFQIYISQKCKKIILYIHDLGKHSGFIILKYKNNFTNIVNVLMDDNNSIICIELPDSKIKLYDSKRLLVLVFPI